MATQKVKNLLVPPYIDKNDSQNVTDLQWTTALNIWISSLSLILKSKNEEFSNYLFYNESLRKFLETFLGIRAKIRKFDDIQIRQPIEIDLDKKVLAILLRLSEPSISSIKVKNEITLGEALYQDKMISVPFLLDVVAMYGRSNINQIEKFFDNIIKSVTIIIQDFETHSSTIVNYIKVIDEKFQEIVDNEKTSKSVIYDKKKIENALNYLEYMLDISVTLDCLFIVSKPVANIFNDRQDFEDNIDFLMTIKNFYDNTIPIISKLFESDDESLNISRDLIILKHALVSLAYHTLNACYFSPIGFTVNEGDIFSFVKSDDKLEDVEEINLKIETMGDILLSFIESSQLDKPVESFVDAPLLLDVEIEFDLSGKLTRIKNESDKLPWQIRLEEKQRRHLASLANNINYNPLITQQSDKIDTIENSDVQRISLISQVQDLFPDLGEGFIEECLITFDNNVEIIINRLLEDSLPDHLKELDRSMARLAVSVTNDSVNGPKVEESLLAQRQNIFDNDEFDVFSGKNIDFTRVNKGKKNGLKMRGINLRMIDEIDEDTEASNTAKGKVNPGIAYESELIKAFQSDQSIFERTNAVRKSDKRARLRNITQMTDEQLEGWYIMFQRNPRKDKILEKYEFKGNREEASSSASEKETSSSGDSLSRPGRGGHTATGTTAPTARGRGRGKHQKKHNRKNAHSRKMGRGFGTIQD
ncbi:14842_t:CDS:2 [Dentiscutata erythropus]|uniref:14842_t:CDS:1 n=1 Tax=Dentiscutata erythropus TaxID=1348616 RepID=A0A9N8ZJQ4_9GLOM|nr:14842_t:CDS:2 [Dentiscutata erythropus]